MQTCKGHTIQSIL